VVSIVNPGGMPLSQYLYRDTTDPRFAIRAPLNVEKIKVKVMLEALLQARMEHDLTLPATIKASELETVGD
jgi:hypothetical protein